MRRVILGAIVAACAAVGAWAYRAEAEVIHPSRIADDAAVDEEVAVGIGDVRHQWRG